MFCNRRYFQQWMKSHQLVFASQQNLEGLKQLTHEVKELLTSKAVSITVPLS